MWGQVIAPAPAPGILDFQVKAEIQIRIRFQSPSMSELFKKPICGPV